MAIISGFQDLQALLLLL